MQAGPSRERFRSNGCGVLLGYLQDGWFEIDNNLVENENSAHGAGTQAMVVHR
jgi:hypothetical protein